MREGKAVRFVVAALLVLFLMGGALSCRAKKTESIFGQREESGQKEDAISLNGWKKKDEAEAEGKVKELIAKYFVECGDGRHFTRAISNYSEHGRKANRWAYVEIIKLNYKVELEYKREEDSLNHIECKGKTTITDNVQRLYYPGEPFKKESYGDGWYGLGAFTNVKFKKQNGQWSSLVPDWNYNDKFQKCTCEEIKKTPLWERP